MAVPPDLPTTDETRRPRAALARGRGRRETRRQREAARRSARRPRGSRLHPRLRRPGGAARKTCASPHATSNGSRAARRASCRGTCGLLIALGGGIGVIAAVARHPDRPPRAARHGVAPGDRRHAQEAREDPRAPARPGRPAQHQPARRGRAGREGGRAPAGRHPRAARPRRRGLRVGQGLVGRQPALDVGIRRDRRARRARTSRRSTSRRPRPARPSSSTSTWRSTATST